MKSEVSRLLLVLVLIASFLVGVFWTEVRLLKGEAAFPTFLKSVTKKPLTPPAKVDIKVTQDDPVRGDKNAPLTLVEFADYQCPFCGATSGLNEEMVSYMKKYDPKWEPLGTNLLKDYIDKGKVKLVYKDFAFLDDGTEKGESHLSAMAAHCAGDQGKYWEYHDSLYSHQNGENKGAFSLNNLIKFAQTLKLNTDQFKNCLESNKYLTKVKESTIEGRKLGVNGTPTAFLDGVMLVDDSGQSGAFSYSVYKKRIEDALRAKKKFIFF